jgi:hypothetical protein
MKHCEYSAPVYARVLLFAYMHRLDWKQARAMCPEGFVRANYRQLDLGRASGKTTAICKFCDDHEGCIIISPTVDQAGNLRRRSGHRAYSVEEMMKAKVDRFASSDPMFIFDDVSCRNVLEVIARHRPARFVHIGMG